MGNAIFVQNKDKGVVAVVKKIHFHNIISAFPLNLKLANLEGTSLGTRYTNSILRRLVFYPSKLMVYLSTNINFTAFYGPYIKLTPDDCTFEVLALPVNSCIVVFYKILYDLPISFLL